MSFVLYYFFIGAHTDSENPQTNQNTNRSIFSSINVDNDKSSKHEWINLTSVSSMQDVDRPEPLGRTEQLHDAPTQQKQQSFSNNNSATSVHSTQERLKSSASSRKSVSKESSKTTTVDSDLPELSYTQSLDDPYLNKRVGPAQDVKLQSSSSEVMSNSSESSSDMNTNFTASRFSNETPVTKLLGPAYKQTERFLKDLQDAKLACYSNNETNISGFEEGNFSRSNTFSKDESIQVGKSKLSISSRSSNSPEILQRESRRSSTKKRSENLTEQDIASASVVDGDLDSTGNLSNDLTKKFGSNEEQSSEGELALNELSTSINSLSERRSRSRGTASSHQPSLNLEPITEILSPEKSNISRDFSKEDSFNVISIQKPMSSTSTPYDNVAKHASSHGIYDVRDSTGPGSTNRKRVLKGETPLSKGSKSTIDPFQVYVSEESKLAVTTGSSQGTINSSKPQIDDSALSSLSKINILPKRSNKDMNGSESIDFIREKVASIDHKKNITMDIGDTPTNDIMKERMSISLKGVITDSSSSTMTDLATPKQQQQPVNVEHNLSAMSGLSIKSKQSSIVKDNNNSNNSNMNIHSNINNDSENDNSNNNNIHFEYSSSKESETTPRSLPRRSYVFPNQAASDHSSNHSNGRKGSSDTDQSSKHEQMKENYRNASLNELWQSFEKSFRDNNDNSDGKIDKSPLLKKLQVVSSLLKESRQRSNQRRHLMSETSATSDNTSYCESHTPYKFPGEMTTEPSAKTRTLRNAKNTKNGVISTKSEFICPVCQRREIGTNFPTPPNIESDTDLHQQQQQRQREESPPLTLQTWTQTSPYIIDSNLFFSTKYHQSSTTSTERDLKEKKSQHKTPGRHHQRHGINKIMIIKIIL